MKTGKRKRETGEGTSEIDRLKEELGMKRALIIHLRTKLRLALGAAAVVSGEAPATARGARALPFATLVDAMLKKENELAAMTEPEEHLEELREAFWFVRNNIIACDKETVLAANLATLAARIHRFAESLNLTPAQIEAIIENYV